MVIVYESSIPRMMAFASGSLLAPTHNNATTKTMLTARKSVLIENQPDTPAQH